MVEGALADPRLRPNRRVLVDHTRATWAGVDGAEIGRRADLLHAQAERIGPQQVVRLFPTVAAARAWFSARL